MRLLTLALATSLAMCASAKQYTTDTLPDEQLHFSFGGGFTGEVREYVLLPNGQLFSRRRVIEELPYREFEPLDPKMARDLFDTYDKRDFAALGYDDPGNMTYTIQRVDGADTSQLVWGGTRQQASEELQSYWRRVMGAVGDRQPAGVAE